MAKGIPNRNPLSEYILPVGINLNNISPVGKDDDIDLKKGVFLVL